MILGTVLFVLLLLLRTRAGQPLLVILLFRNAAFWLAVAHTVNLAIPLVRQLFSQIWHRFIDAYRESKSEFESEVLQA